MKANQYSVKVYETTVDDEIKFMTFFNANHLLFKNHLIVIKGEFSETIEKFLQDKSLKYLHDVTLPRSKSGRAAKKALEEELKFEKVQNFVSQKKSETQLAKLSEKLENHLTVQDDMVRSGREIKIDGDLLLLNRVNSGATIITSGNLIITHVVEGAIRCNGKFMMLTASPKANILFHGVEVDNELLEDKLNRVELKGKKIVITPVLKKEINWA